VFTQLLDQLKAKAIQYAPGYAQALIIILLGLIFARLARRWAGAIIDRSRIGNDLLLKEFFLRVVSVSIIIIAVISALSQIGWDVQTFIAGLGITGLILGFGLKDVLSNFAAGLLLLIYRPFRAGQLIEVEGAKGVVQELTIVNMEMDTTDGVRVIMPNSKVWGAKIINYSVSVRRRIELQIRVRDEDADDAIKAILDEIKADARILLTPEPVVRVEKIADSAATLVLRAWTSPENFEVASGDLYLKLQDALVRAEVQTV
jgi:small conductance mechanosensitive channel